MHAHEDNPQITANWRYWRQESVQRRQQMICNVRVIIIEGGVLSRCSTISKQTICGDDSFRIVIIKDGVLSMFGTIAN